MTGPFGLPWPTFAAIIVVLLSVAISVVWGVASGKRDRGRGGGGE